MARVVQDNPYGDIKVVSESGAITRAFQRADAVRIIGELLDELEQNRIRLKTAVDQASDLESRLADALSDGGNDAKTLRRKK